MATNRAPFPGILWRFVAAVVLVTAAIGVALYYLISQEAIAEAQRSAQDVARVQGLGVVEPALTDGILSGDAAAIAGIDRIVVGRVLDSRTVRVKIWNSSGTILYSDEPRLIGRTFSLGEDEQAVLRADIVDSSVSDLSRPENQYERSFGKLLEVYLPLRTPSGQKVLFETYQEFASVEAQQRRITIEFGQVLGAGLLVLLILQLPLAWSMARGLQHAAREREMLLRRAVEASEGERRRIARDLHDGVVQRLAGTSMSLAAAALESDANHGTAVTRVLKESAIGIREAIRELRSLIVKIAPSGLSAGNLGEALGDLAEPLRERGTEVEVVIEKCSLDDGRARLVFRVAQEALRNVARHARAHHVRLELRPNGSGCLLSVADDGVGFDPAAFRRAHRDGHMGLPLLQSLAEDGGAELRVNSAPGEGSRIEMRVP
jgi:two-component system NarL family sensor kinase